MAKQEKPANYVIVAEPASETLKAALDLVKQQPGQDNLNVIYAGSASETVSRVSEHSPCLVMLSFLESNDLVGGLGLLGAISDKLEQKEVKAVALTKIQNPKFLKVLEKQKVSVVISEPIAMRTLMFKLLLQIKSLDVIRKSIEQKLKRNEKIQFRNSDETKGPQDDSALRFKRIENGTQKNFLMAGDSKSADLSELKTAASELREVFQKVTTDELNSSSLVLKQGDQPTPTGGKPPAEAVLAEPANQGAHQKDSGMLAEEQREPTQNAVGFARSEQSIEEVAARKVGAGKNQPIKSSSSELPRVEEIRKKQLENSLERMREQKLKQLALEDRVLKSKEEGVARAKLNSLEVEKRERSRREKMERHKAEKEKLPKAPGKEIDQAIEPDENERAEPVDQSQAEAREGKAIASPGPESDAAEEGQSRPKPAGALKEKSSSEASESGVELREVGKPNPGPERSVANTQKESAKDDEPAAPSAGKDIEVEATDENSSEENAPDLHSPDEGQAADIAARKNQKKRSPKKSISSHLEKILRQRKSIEGKTGEDIAGELQDISEDSLEDGEPTEKEKKGKARRTLLESPAEGDSDAAIDPSDKSELGEADEPGKEKLLAQDEPSIARTDSRTEPGPSASESLNGSFEFGQSADPSSWSDLDLLEKPKPTKNKRGFSDNFEEEKVAWDAKSRRGKSAANNGAEKIPEVILAKSLITPDPGGWVKVGKFYVYCKDSLYANPIARLADTLPICVYEGDTKPGSHGIFWLFERKKPLVVEEEGDLDPVVAKFLGKFLRTESSDSSEEPTSSSRSGLGQGEAVGSESSTGKKRLREEIREAATKEGADGAAQDRLAPSGETERKKEKKSEPKAPVPEANEAIEKGLAALSDSKENSADVDDSSPTTDSANLYAEPQKKKRGSDTDDRIEAISRALDREARGLSESEVGAAAQEKIAAAEEDFPAEVNAPSAREREKGTSPGQAAKPKKQVEAGAVEEGGGQYGAPGLASEESSPGGFEHKKKLPAMLGDLLSRLSRKGQGREELIGAPILSPTRKKVGRPLPLLMLDRAKGKRELPRLSGPAGSSDPAAKSTEHGGAQNGPAEEAASSSDAHQPTEAVNSTGQPAPQVAANAPSQARNSLAGLENSKPLQEPINSALAGEPNLLPSRLVQLERWRFFQVAQPPKVTPSTRQDPKSRAEEIARELSKDQKAHEPKLSRGQELALHMASAGKADRGSSDSSHGLLSARARLEALAPNLILAAVRVDSAGEISVLAGECPFRDLAELRAAAESAWASNLMPGQSGLVAVAREGKRRLQEEERITLERVGAEVQSGAA